MGRGIFISNRFLFLAPAVFRGGHTGPLPEKAGKIERIGKTAQRSNVTDGVNRHVPQQSFCLGKPKFLKKGHGGAAVSFLINPADMVAAVTKDSSEVCHIYTGICQVMSQIVL